MAKALANQGADIVAVARRQNLIDEVAEDIAKEFGVKTLAVRCDITDTAQVETMVDTVLQAFGRIYTPLTVDTLNSDFFQQNAKTMIPEKRYGEEGELDTAVLFLASSASAYVTGVNLPVDGGYTAM